ncbi:hypothetical protein CPter291_0819 [Collimonas pratensis]|uniref:Uncharacterized protein n=1 Tax=Collimonas pratensis TaxID=279113 RepID=A0A127QSM9_9BURK|nr:hypothetical protein CPter91_0902 [Collimonas pratensis]AMP13098.1 hypothetical protein CPter291_0819 [Collimonas pratensis]
MSLWVKRYQTLGCRCGARVASDVQCCRPAPATRTAQSPIKRMPPCRLHGAYYCG